MFASRAIILRTMKKAGENVRHARMSNNCSIVCGKFNSLVIQIGSGFLFYNDSVIVVIVTLSLRNYFTMYY